MMKCRLSGNRGLKESNSENYQAIYCLRIIELPAKISLLFFLIFDVALIWPFPLWVRPGISGWSLASCSLMVRMFRIALLNCLLTNFAIKLDPFFFSFFTFTQYELQISFIMVLFINATCWKAHEDCGVFMSGCQLPFRFFHKGATYILMNYCKLRGTIRMNSDLNGILE